MLVAAFAVTVMGCAETRFESTWRDPAAAPGQLQGQRVAAVVDAGSEAFRRSGEDALVRALARHGVMGIPGYRLLAEESSDPETLYQQLNGRGLAAVVVMKVIDSRAVLSQVGPYYGVPYSGWDYGWSTAGYPMYTVTRVETTVHSLRSNSLLWAGVSRTLDPTRLDQMISQVAAQATKEMKKQGLVKQ
ncbi:MAG TPA: hypothetical protein VN914_13640 [Polyangia bacterium]|nr:hypothetical protein [Polyangia bacterium]